MRIASPLTTEASPCLQWIELASSFQIPALFIIGLAAPEVCEARERVRAAIEASGYEFPKRRILINLSPASVRKRGTGADLGMALAILSSLVNRTPDISIVAWAELGLDGKLKPCGQITRSLYAAWASEAHAFVFSRDEMAQVLEANSTIRHSGDFVGRGPLLIPATHLREIWEILNSGQLTGLDEPEERGLRPLQVSPSLLALPPVLERVICTAVAGGHHLLLLGPKGIGKSHSLEWLLSLLPALEPKIALQNRLLRELGMSSLAPQNDPVPVRRIGPQVRVQALLGGVHNGQIHAGEFSLAHGGVLLADEILEWPRDSLEALREPLERGQSSLNRAQGSVELPARFRLAATANLCPCGGIPKEVPRVADFFAVGTCICKPARKRDYLAKLSGPILDRLDLVCRITTSHPRPHTQNPLEALRHKILHAQKILRSHWDDLPGDIPADRIEAWLRERPRFESALGSTPTLRSRHKIVRVALTLAALEDRTEPSSHHFREAQIYRPERFLS